jgi:hypothetical protein
MRSVMNCEVDVASHFPEFYPNGRWETGSSGVEIRRCVAEVVLRSDIKRPFPRVLSVVSIASYYGGAVWSFKLC